MAKMRSRTEALVNAYLNNYQNANAATVSGGQSAQQSAQSRGSSIMNATDKTLPVLKDYSADVLNGIVKSADNAQNTAISNFKLAKKQIEAEQKAAEKAAKAAAKSSGRSSSKKSDKRSSSTSSTDDASGSNTSLDSLFGDVGNTSTSSQKSSGGNYSKTRTNEERNASARARYDDSKQEKSDVKYRAHQKAERTAQMLKDKQAAANAGANKGKAAGKTYAEQKNAGNAAAQPAQSRATGKAGNIIGSTVAAAGQAPSAAETQAAKDKRNDYKSRQEDIAAALKKLQTDEDYRAELAQPGRRLTGAEIQAVKEYNQKPGDLFKQVQAGELSLDDYNKQGQELAQMNQKAESFGMGQDMLAFTAGLMTSVPFEKQVDSAITNWADDQTNGKYSQARESGAVTDFLQALEESKELNRIAAGAGTMAGKAAQYSLFNNLMEGTPLAETMGKVGGKVAGTASKVPVLGQFATPAAGEALGRILTDQTADTALDTIPSLVNDLQTYDDQQSRIKNGEQVDDALTHGQIGLNTLGNVAQNFAFNAIPEVGGAVLNRMKGTAGDAVQDALKQADNAVQDVQKSVPARNIVQPEANGTTGLAAQLQQLNTPDAANRSALDTLDELRRQVNLNGAQEKEAEQLRRAVLQRQQEIGDEAKLALQNSDSLPIDAQAAKAYNEVNGGVVNDNLGTGVRADVPGIADSRASTELQPGNIGDGISGQAAEGGQNSTASVLGRGVQGNDAKSAAQVAEWAKSITGKGRQSVYTRRIENLHNAMQNGASRESLAEEAANIAAGLVKESDFAEPLDEATSELREYMKRTPIRLDEKAAGDILYTSGLKNIQQYNFQNGTKFSLTDGIPYDTAMQELGEMGVGVNGSSIDDLLKAVDASNAKPLVDSDQAAAYSDYLRDRILDGPSDTQMGAEDFADWLDVQSFDRDAPDYVQRLLERDNLTAIDAAADTGYNDINNIGGVTNEAVQGRNQYDGTRSEGILQGSSDGTPQSGKRLAVGAESGEYLPANRVLVAEHLNQRPSVYNDSTRAIAEQAGAGAFDFRNSDDAPETFAQALATAKANNVNGAAVDGHTAEEIANIVNNGGKTFLTPDGTAGGAVEANGNLTCVFKDAANNSTPGAGSSIALAAVNYGATKGDCYGRALVNMYSKAGLEPVARIPYAYGYNDAMDAQVRKQIADGIISKEPDVYALKLRDGYDFEKAAAEFNTAHRYTQAELDSLPVYDDYDEMLAYRDSLLKSPSADAGGAAFLQPTEAVSEPVPGLNIVENAQSAAKLNGSESVHPNTVGSKEREMPYQEYAGRGHSVTDIDRDTLTPENQNILGTNAPYTVQRVSHAEQQANAQQIRSNEGLSATIDRIVKDSTSGSFSDETETLAGNALRELNEKLNTLEPNTTEYAKTATQARIVRSKMREGLTKTARTLESAKQFTTPEKAVMNIEGILSDARDAAQKKNPGAFKKVQKEIENAVEGGRSEANAQLGEIVTNELSKIVGAGKQAAGNGNAGQAATAAKEVPVLDNPEDAWARAVARKTGNYAQDNLKKADPDDLFAKEIVNQLFETAKESPVAQGARAKNGYTAQEKLNLAFDAQDDYATVWNKARSIAQKNYKNNPDMTSRLQAFFDNVKDEGSLYSNKTVLSAFTENLKENDDTFRQLADRAAFGNKSEISRAANRLADAVEVPDEYRSGFLKTAESVLANSKQLTGAQAHADGRAFRAALNRAGFTVGDIADASAFGNDISPVMAAHEIMETLNPPAEYRQTVFDNVYNYIKNNDGYQKQMEKADSRVLRRLVSNVDGGYTSIANKAAFGSDAGMQATVSDFLDEINAPTSLRGEMGDRLQKAITGNAQYQKAAAGADSRVFNEAVRHVQEELEFTFQKLSGESDASKAKVLDGLKNTITDYLGVDDSQAAEVVQNIEKMYNSALSDGAMKRLAQIFPDTNKTANAPRDQFLELLRIGAYNDEYMGEAVKDLAATKFGIQQLSDEQVANIKQLAEQMETLPKDSKARVDIENEIATIAAGNVKGSFWDKWNAMRYTSMLFNAVTNIKNAVNNVGQGTLALLKDGVKGAVQRVAKAMGNDTAEVTVGYLNPASKADRNLIGRSFADADNSRWRQLTGTSENFEMAKAARNAGQTFNTRVMRTIDQMSSAMLEDADVYGTSGLLSFAKPLNENNALRKAAEFAQDATKSMGENGFIGVAGLKNNYSRYLASYLKAHGATDAIFDATDDASKAILEQARDYAVQQALVNTYHEANKLTEFIGKVKKSANDVPILGAWVEGQLPFVKTPTNVGIQAWRYSPGGLLQGLLQMGYDAAKGKDINKAMDTFSAGLTGSAIAGLGAYLWSTGHLVPGMTDEEKAEADLTGAQENSLQFTDKNGKLHSYTINWFSNWAGPMMVGANLAKWLDTRNDTSTSVVDKVLNACVSVLDPVIDNSYLSSLNNTIDQLGNAQTGGEKAATLLTSGFGNYFTQAIPTLSGQLARTIDPTRRSTYTGLTGAAKNFAYFGQKSKNKIPVLSQSSEPYIDVWGNEEKNFTPASGEDASDYAARAAYNFLSPGYYSESSGDEVSQYVEGLYKSTGDKNLLPKNSSARGYTVSVPSLDGGDSTEQRLTPQEKTVYDKTYGQTAYDIVDSLRQNDMFLKLPEDQQSALVQEAYSVAKTVGGVAAVGDGVSGTNSKAYEAYQQGGVPTLESYLLAKNATDIARDEKREATGSDTASLDTVETWNTLYSQFGDDAVSNFVNSTSKDSTVRNISDIAGDKAVTAYMQAYSAVSKTLDDGQTPNKFTVGYGMQKYGLSGDDFARAYLAAYYKKDKNGKYPEKGGTYADKAGAEIYQSYGADALRDWVNYRATVHDTNGNGKVDKDEAMARLNEMSLTDELRRAYLTNTNKSWKNPY